VSGRVLVTGATGGLGQAIARAFAARGAGLVLTGRRLPVLEPLAQELGARAIECDVTDRAQLDRLVREAGEVDVLIANAALPGSGLLTDFSQEQVDRVLEVNLRAPVALARALTPAMSARRSGHMVFISSLAGKSASPASSLYSATKFGLRGFALGLREDLRPHGVGVSIVAPGFVRDAGMFADAGVELPWYVRTRSPQNVADAVLRAIEHDRAEIDVAPLSLRLGASFASVAPGLAAEISRRLGADKIALAHVEGQREKR
jgi:short-subunit dehydrogenase